MHESSLYSTDHLARTLGGFSFTTQQPVVYTGTHAERWQVAVTMFHEQTHQMLSVSTPYGVLQALLGYTAAASARPNAPEWIREGAALLNQSIRASWATHEGYAVASEEFLMAAAGQSLPLTRLPPDYLHAYGLYRRALAVLPEPYHPFEPLIAKAVAFAVLGSPVLDEWDPRRESAGELATLLSREEHTPDRRLDLLSRTLVLPEADAELLYRAYHEGAARAGVPPELSLEQGMLRVGACCHPPLFNALFGITAGILDRALPLCCPGLRAEPLTRLERRVLAFFRSTRAHLATRGIHLPEPVHADDASPTELASAQFRPRPLMTPVPVPPESAPALLASAPEADACYIVHLIGRVLDTVAAGSQGVLFVRGTAGNEEPTVVFAHLIRHVPIGSQGDRERGHGAYMTDLDAPSPLMGGAWNDVRAVLAGLGDRVLALAVDESLADLRTGGIWPPVSELADELGTETVVVAPGTGGVELRQRLREIFRGGADTLELAADDGVVRVLAARVNGGGTVLLPLGTPAVIAVEKDDPDLMAWMLDTLEATQARTEPHAAAIHPSLPAWGEMVRQGYFDVAL